MAGSRGPTVNLIRVIKIGGSLLRRERLLFDLQHWQANLTGPMVNVWLTGGGLAVDAIREQYRVQRLSDTAAHWASIEAMDDNAAMLARYLPDWQITDTPEKILQLTNEHNSRSPQQSLSGTYEISQSGENWLLQTRRWIASVSGRLDTQPQLPCNWDVTSDSIAAWVAIQLHASQLILLKSCSVPTATVSELARQGIIDAYMPTLALQRYSTQFACEHLPCTSHERHEKNAPNN